MPSHTIAERKKKKPGAFQRARSIITEGIGGFKKREAQQSLERSTIQQPFRGRKEEGRKRFQLIGKTAPAKFRNPIIASPKTPTSAPRNATQKIRDFFNPEKRANQQIGRASCRERV